jgi:hypothetical protein
MEDPSRLSRNATTIYCFIFNIFKVLVIRSRVPVMSTIVILVDEEPTVLKRSSRFHK